MREVVYIDVLMVENILMNFMLLYAVNRFCKCKASILRLSLASFFGALYILTVFLPELYVLYSLSMKIIISIIMIIIAFSPYTLRQIVKLLLLFYITAFLACGAIMGVFYLSDMNVEVVNGNFSINNISAYHIIIGSIVAISIVKVAFDFLENHYSMEKRRIKLDVFQDGKKCELNALVDTGNTLRDPLTGNHVIVAFINAISPIMPSEVQQSICFSKNYDELNEVLIDSSVKKRIRIIPFKALGTENGVLTALRVDYVVVKYKKQNIIVKDVLIALYEKPISEDGSFDALAYPELLKGGAY